MEFRAWMKSSFSRLLVSGVTLLALTFTHAAQVVLRPSADASLMEVAPNNNNGGEAWSLGGTTQNFTRNRALMTYDFSEIPANSTITAVSMMFEVTRRPADGFNPAPFGLHRMLVSWGEGNKIAIDNAGGMGAPATEGEVTWNSRYHSLTPWVQPGGAAGSEYALEPSSVEYIYGPGESPYFFRSTELLIQDVQYWLSNPTNNFGWMIVCQTEDVNFTARRFASSEDPLDLGPYLFVDFEAVPEPSTWALISVGGLIVIVAQRQLRRRALQ